MARSSRQGLREADSGHPDQLVQGYNVLYQNDIIHLDIRTENVLVSRGNYKLADFGLSAIQDPSQTVKR